MNSIRDVHTMLPIIKSFYQIYSSLYYKGLWWSTSCQRSYRGWYIASDDGTCTIPYVDIPNTVCRNRAPCSTIYGLVHTQRCNPYKSHVENFEYDVYLILKKQNSIQASQALDFFLWIIILTGAQRNQVYFLP